MNEIVHRWTTEDGRTFTVDDEWCLFRADDGDDRGFLILSQNAIARELARLAEENKRLRAALHHHREHHVHFSRQGEPCEVCAELGTALDAAAKGDGR